MFTILNFRGTRFEIAVEVFQKINANLMQDGFQKVSDEGGKATYYINRSPEYFGQILGVLSGRKFHISGEFEATEVLEELQFWGLTEEVLSQENLTRYRRAIEKEALQNYIIEDLTSIQGNKFWQFLDYPRSSIGAAIYCIVMILVVLASVMLSAASTLPQMKHYRIVNGSGNNASPIIEDYDERKVDIFEAIEIVTVVILAVEIIVRFILSPRKCIFFKSFLNWSDILAVVFASLSFVIMLFIHPIAMVFRLMRLGRLGKLFLSLRALIWTVRISITKLLFIFVFYCLATAAFSFMVYAAEAASYSSHFRSVPDAFWWAIITLTTVGYGDMRPISPIGKVVGAFCGLFGILLISLSFGIIGRSYWLVGECLEGVSDGGMFKKKPVVQMESVGDTNAPLMKEKGEAHGSGL